LNLSISGIKLRKYFPEHVNKLMFHDELEFPEKLRRFEKIQLEELRR